MLVDVDYFDNEGNVGQCLQEIISAINVFHNRSFSPPFALKLAQIGRNF